MKIQLEAFGIMKSQPMNVPDDTGFRWDMALIQPLSVATSKTPEFPPFPTICTFEWDGKSYESNGEYIKIYQLTNIRK